MKRTLKGILLVIFVLIELILLGFSIYVILPLTGFIKVENLLDNVLFVPYALISLAVNLLLIIIGQFVAKKHKREILVVIQSVLLIIAILIITAFIYVVFG